MTRITYHGFVISETFSDMVLAIAIRCVRRFLWGRAITRDGKARRISEFLRVSQSSYVRFCEFRLRTDKQHRERERRRIMEGY